MIFLYLYVYVYVYVSQDQKDLLPFQVFMHCSTIKAIRNMEIIVGKKCLKTCCI